MRVLIDIGHPAHIHYFRHFAVCFAESGNEVLFTCRNKGIIRDLLAFYTLQFKCIGRHYRKLAGKVLGLFLFVVRIFVISHKYKPDIYLSAGSMYAAITAWLRRKPHITLEDTGNMEQIRLYLPFTKAVLTPESFHLDLGEKQIRINGYNELTYLHPKRFKKLSEVKDDYGLTENENFILLRFVSWNATHDIGHLGLSKETKQRLIDTLKRKYKVFISSEGEVPKEFTPYEIRISPEKIHWLLESAQIYIGEGATMASESAILGTPSVYVNSLKAGTITDQEKYGVLFHFSNEMGVIEKVQELMEIPDIKNVFKLKRNHMLAGKIDYTGFLLWFVENWPQSFRIMKDNPDYQLRFQ